MSQHKRLYLASASPRRKQLLAQLALDFTVFPVDADESVLANESGATYVQRLAEKKASMAFDEIMAQRPHDCLVIGADTSVVVGNTILGKPAGQADFKAMMQDLSGQEHRVLTGLSVLGYDSGAGSISPVTTMVQTRVRFKSLNAREIDAYWRSGEPADKAGGYGIQGLGAVFVASIEGSYSNVVGLPLAELSSVLRELGLDHWDQFPG